MAGLTCLQKSGGAAIVSAVGRASQPASPTGNKPQGVERMANKGMNASELQALKDALLKAERLEMLAILREADSLSDAIAALEQRLKA